MRVLVVAAHPDDEVLGCGGTIARLAGSGHDVFILILGEGSTSRSQQREQADLSLVETLHQNSFEAAKVLGAKEVFMRSLPDNRFDTVPLLDIVKLVEELVTELTPEVIYTHHGGDLNIDHALTHRAVLTATRPVAGQPVREIYAFEVPSSTEWAFQRLEPIFRPNVFEDISETLDLKIKALSFYESETRPFPHPRSPEALRAIAQRWGSVVGHEAVEAFELVRAIRFKQ
jgi:LmbE family N-acetylglucosaminyl deacetylase